MLIQRPFYTKLTSWMLPRGWRNANKEVMLLKRQLEAMAPRLSEVSCPVVIVHGDCDRLVPVGNVDYMKERLPDAEAVVLEDEDHFIVWTAEDDIREVISRLLQ